ncbi:MAG: hypothetical protein AB1757_25380 [Acidobacteriota bacterium]
MNQAINEVCHNHPHLAAAFTCTACHTNFCRHCVKFINTSTVCICTLCGSLCAPFAELKQKHDLQVDRQTAFGFEDFKFAIGYPLQEIFTLLGVSAIYGAGYFSLTFYALKGVGGVLGSLGLLPAFLVNAMMIGCARLIIKRLETGRSDSADVFDLSYLLSEFWTSVRIAAAIFMVVSLPTILILRFSSTPLIEQSFPVFLLMLSWTIFYYPIAVLVAYLSGSFWTTINPIFGLSAMLKLGATFLRLFGFYLILVAIASTAVYLISAVFLRAGFNIVLFLSLGLFVAPPIFYANMVLAALIGRALFKHGDQL